MKICGQCGMELPPTFSKDICLDCARANLKKSLDADPELKQAFKKSIENLKKPENIKAMADNTVKFMQGIQALQKR